MLLGYIDPGIGFTVGGGIAGLIAIISPFLAVILLRLKQIYKFIRRHKRWVGLLLALGTLIILAGVVMHRKESAFNKKIVILGFDGLSPKIIEPLMRKGELPNFSRLKEEGSYSRLATTNPSQSPVAWTGFATGANPGKNGIFDFIVRNPKTYSLTLSLSNIKGLKPVKVKKMPSFWNYTSEKRIPTVIISCPVTFPADKVYGRMLSGMGVPDILGTEGTFTFYTSEELKKEQDIGGKVFRVNRKEKMQLYLIGPRKATAGEVKNVKVPFKVILNDNSDSVEINLEGRNVQLKAGQWSDWQQVSFSFGLLKKMKGIFKFYLVETNPEFKLYISPINFDPRAASFQISYPKGYCRELAKNIGLFHTQGMPMDTWAVNEMRLKERPFLEQVNEVLRERKAMLDYELARLRKGVLFCYFESPDIIQHMFWRYRDPQHPLYEEDSPQDYKDMIENWYKKMDGILGNVMNNIEKDDTLIVLSDHGFDTFRRTVHLNTWFRENGYLALKNPSAKSGGELFKDIDWPRTKAYSIGFGAIYINQEGREGEGTVSPGAETEGLKREISEKLKEWLDEENKSPLISNVYSREDIFWGPSLEDTPDLYVGFNIGYRASWQTALGAVPDRLIENNLKKWSGDHLFAPKLIPGVLFLNKQINSASPSIYDIAPTILKQVGFSEEEINELGMDGEELVS